MKEQKHLIPATQFFIMRAEKTSLLYITNGQVKHVVTSIHTAEVLALYEKICACEIVDLDLLMAERRKITGAERPRPDELVGMLMKTNSIGLPMVAFTTTEELCALTGLPNTDALWDAGFNLDDWDIGFQTDAPFHKDSDDIESGGYREVEVDYNSPYYWLMQAMCDYCVGPSHTMFQGKHYYLAHHA